MTIYELEQKANEARKLIVRSLNAAGSGHSAGSLGMADILTTLYFHVMKHDPAKPHWADRDRFVLSCGHSAPALYSVLALAGYFDPEDMNTLRKFGSHLQGHPHLGELPGIETSSGPLGIGLSQAIGMALAARMDNKDYYTYCLMSDGEQNEGNVWEAFMFASKMKLRNLIAITDRNNIQIDGFTEDIMPLEPLKEKYTSFGWKVIETNGNSIGNLIQAFDEAKHNYSGPTIILAHTIPGKGVDFMENDYAWHGKTPNDEQLKDAISQLEAKC